MTIALASPAALRRPSRIESKSVHMHVAWATTQEEVRGAQRLRHEVFADELGARLVVPPGTPAGHDADRYDDHCEHLIVTAVSDDDEPLVIGTYRVLTPAAARRAGGLYSDSEFDLSPLDPIRDHLMELGRSCVHPQWRHGGVVLLMWNALSAFMQQRQLGAMIGCASVGMRDGGAYATRLWQQLQCTSLADPAWRVTPRLALNMHACAASGEVDVPPLIRGYLRCGAKLLGPPAWDPEFGTADLPMMVWRQDLPQRYR
jgi:putative hemolysin